MEQFFLPAKRSDWAESVMKQNCGQLALYVWPTLGKKRLGTISKDTLDGYFAMMGTQYSLSIVRNVFYII